MLVNASESGVLKQGGGRMGLSAGAGARLADAPRDRLRCQRLQLVFAGAGLPSPPVPPTLFATFPEIGLKPSFVRWLFQGRLLS